MADDVTQRRLVPSERQVAFGAVAPEVAFVDHADADDDATRIDLRGVVRQWVRDADPRGIEGPVIPIAVLALSALFGAWDDVAFGILLPEIQSEFAISLGFLVGLSTQLLIITTIVGPPMGYLADRVKRVWMVRIGAVLGNVASILAGTAGSVPALVGSRVLGGVAEGVGKPAGFPLLTDYYAAKSRARVFSFLFAAGSLGTVIGPTVAGELASRFGWRSALIVLGCLATFVSFGTFFLREPKRGMQDRLEMGASEEVAEREQPPVTFGEGWRAARSIGTLRRFWIASPILYIGGTGATLLMGLYFARVFQLGARERGWILTAGAVVGFVGIVFSGPVTDRLLRDRPGRVLSLLGTVVVAQAASFALLSASPSLILSVAFTLPIAFASALIQPAFITLISLVVPPRIRGFGIQTTSWFNLIGILFFRPLVVLAEGYGMRKGLLVFVPFFIIGGIVIASAAGGVDRDIRAAMAASMADEEAVRARLSGRNKMLICRDVDVDYDGVQVLFNVDFDVDEGEVVALLGTNGAGKSTLLRAIAGIQEPSNGAIFLDGIDITHAPPFENAARGVVMMPGGSATFPTLTVEENLHTAAWLHREDAEFVRARTNEVLELFPILRERLQMQAGNLSGGEQQMVGLGQALLMKPRLLMIDELSLGLAPSVVQQLLDVLEQIHAQGTTILLVEQSLNVALTIAERAVFMEKGEIRFDGPTEELLAHPELVRSVFMGGGVSGGGIVTTPRARQAHADAPHPMLEVHDVAVSFGGVQALRAASLTVAPGEIVGIIGPNGAGKTTLFDVVSGFVQPDAGEVQIDGLTVDTLVPDARSRLGLARSFQSARLFPALTVRENIAVALERRAVKNPGLAIVSSPKLRKGEQKLYRRVDGLIELLGLNAFADKFVGELSTGSRRAVDVACVMAAEPKMLLLDEPSSGLAQAETEELGPVITRIVRETGCGVLVIEHDMPLISSMSDRLVAMELGTTIVDGTPAEVMNDPRVLASYLAASSSVIERSNSARVGALAAAALDSTHKENPT
jgi:ABC-type branched-subunit amino acid transport system ATPase component/MFS family permease